MRHPPKRHPKIVKAGERLDKAEAQFKATVAAVQKACKHDVILERPSGIRRYTYIEDTYHHGVRVCAECGYIEEVRYGWPGTTTTTPLYNSKKDARSILNRADFQIDDERLQKEIIYGVCEPNF